jgi:hypothetical protein
VFLHVSLSYPTACPISKGGTAYLQEKSIQKFWMVVNYVEKKQVDDLVRNLKHGKALTKDQVIRESEMPVLFGLHSI